MGHKLVIGTILWIPRFVSFTGLLLRAITMSEGIIFRLICPLSPHREEKGNNVENLLDADQGNILQGLRFV